MRRLGFALALSVFAILWFVAAAVGTKLGLWEWQFGLGVMTITWGPLLLMVAAWWVARKRGYPTEPFPGLAMVGRLDAALPRDDAVAADLHVPEERFAEKDGRRAIAHVEAEMNELITESGEGAGDDQADSGTKTFEREHEMSLVINARDMVLQTERALDRIDNKSYGNCEECGYAIGKARLQVFPRATLCMICKQKEERR